MYVATVLTYGRANKHRVVREREKQRERETERERERERERRRNKLETVGNRINYWCSNDKEQVPIHSPPVELTS